MSSSNVALFSSRCVAALRPSSSIATILALRLRAAVTALFTAAAVTDTAFSCCALLAFSFTAAASTVASVEAFTSSVAVVIISSLAIVNDSFHNYLIVLNAYVYFKELYSLFLYVYFVSVLVRHCGTWFLILSNLNFFASG